MTTEIVSTDSLSLQTIDNLDLDVVNGGYDFSAAMQAGNAAAGPGREAGQTLGSGFDAAKTAFTGKPSTIGSQVGAPLGAAAGFAGGFASNSYSQLRGKH